MSEYQYYEFQAVDRPLTPQETAELRALSTRARITPTQFQNVYHWGDFKGEPFTLMERYFDAFIYVANWGTHRFMLRLPRRLLDEQTTRPYAVDGSPLIQVAKGHEAYTRAEILRRFRQANAPRADARAGGRAVANLLSAAEERAELRRRQEAERKAAEQARREREQAAARAKYLDSLIGREEDLWRQVEALIEAKRPREYDQAVQLLKDLHHLSARQERADAFAARLGPLRDRYAKRPSLIERLDRAGLRA